MTPEVKSALEMLSSLKIFRKLRHKIKLDWAKFPKVKVWFFSILIEEIGSLVNDCLKKILKVIDLHDGFWVLMKF